ncbi:MAG: ComEC/Rec2 family competence protein [Fimbriimonadales bacterium]
MLPLFFAGLLSASSPAFLLLAVPGALLARRCLLLGAALFAAGFLRVALSPAVLQGLPPLQTEITGRIVSTPNLGARWQRVVVDTGDRFLLLYTSPDRDLRAGDVIRYEAKPRNLDGPGGAYWYRRGIRQSTSVYFGSDIEVVSPSSGMRAFGSLWRRDLLARLESHLPREVAAVAIGIVAGQQDIVPDPIIDDMNRAGTLHLLATSGFNVLLLAGALLFLASHLPLPRWVQVGLVILLLIIYADAVGGRPPVMRATVMAAVFLSAFLFGRSSDGLSAMALVAIGSAFVEPWTVLDAGFQLSFMVVFGLILFAPSWFRRIRAWTDARSWPRPFQWAALATGTSLATTLVAMAFATPILSTRFGTFSLVAPAANLVTSMAVPFVYAGVAAGSVGDLISDDIARGADAAITGPFSASVIRSNHTFASLPMSGVEGIFMPAWLAVALYLLLFGVSRPPPPIEIET